MPLDFLATPVVERGAGRAVGIWRAFGVGCLAMVGCFAVFVVLGIFGFDRAAGRDGEDERPLRFGWTGMVWVFHGWVVTVASAARTTRAEFSGAAAAATGFGLGWTLEGQGAVSIGSHSSSNSCGN